MAPLRDCSMARQSGQWIRPQHLSCRKEKDSRRSASNQEICRKVTDKCYVPATRKILDLIHRHEGRFRVSYSISGTALEQFELWAPEVIELFQECAATGAVEFLAETSHHSLSFLFSREEFQAQVAEQEARIERLFGVRPTVFRNTELIYSNEVSSAIAEMGRHRAVICEGIDELLAHRSPNYVYMPPGGPPTAANDGGPIRLLLKNYQQ